jgi:hypothetical protein
MRGPRRPQVPTDREENVRARIILSALALALGLSVAGTSRADVPDSRVGITPSIGGGMAALGGSGPLPGFIGYTTLGAEIFGQLRRWGLYLRFDFLSSGNGGRWTAYEGSLGGSYRLFGDSDSFSLFARAGLVYEHWVGAQLGGCSVLLLVPNSCVTEGQATLSVNADALGLSGGFRLEMPFKSFYLAVGTSFVPVVTVDEWANSAATTLEPGAVFQLRLDLELGFRDTRSNHKATHDPNERRRQE